MSYRFVVFLINCVVDVDDAVDRNGCKPRVGNEFTGPDEEVVSHILREAAGVEDHHRFPSSKIGTNEGD